MQAMTQDDKDFIRTLIKGLEDKIDSIKALFDEKVNNVKYEVDKHRVDIIDIYEKLRGNSAKMNEIDNDVIAMQTDIKNHKDNHTKSGGNMKWVIGFIFMLIFSGAGLVLSIIKAGG
jgi:hypothetical protein